MPPLVRRIIAVVAALACASVIVLVLEYVGARLFPVPGVDMSNREQVEGAMRDGRVPRGALAMVGVAWLAGAFIGATVALRIGREGGRGATMIFAALFTLACVATLVAIPHPPWMWFIGAVAVPLAAIVAGRDRSAG